MAHILAVDDEPAVLALLQHTLQKEEHLVTVLSDAAAVSDAQLGSFDLILLDVMMPGIDGFTLCRQIRERVDCPILFLTAKSMESDIMEGLGVGADDYLTKPFGAGELRARVHAHLRREQRERRNIYSLGEAYFNLSGKELVVKKCPVPLTPSEYKISEFLALHRGQVFSKEQIYEHVFSYDKESDASTIVEHIKNIRGKLNQLQFSPLETVWGIGYRWK